MTNEKSNEVRLCDCKDQCPAHPKNRLFHIGNECYHADGTHHTVKA